MARPIPNSTHPLATHRSLRHFSLSSGPVDLKLETELWSVLTVIATDRRMPLSALVDIIDQQRGPQTLTRALWRFAIAYMQALAEVAKTLPPARPRSYTSQVPGVRL